MWNMKRLLSLIQIRNPSEEVYDKATFLTLCLQRSEHGNLILVFIWIEEKASYILENRGDNTKEKEKMMKLDKSHNCLL